MRLFKENYGPSSLKTVCINIKPTCDGRRMATWRDALKWPESTKIYFFLIFGLVSSFPSCSIILDNNVIIDNDHQLYRAVPVHPHLKCEAYDFYLLLHMTLFTSSI